MSWSLTATKSLRPKIHDYYVVCPHSHFKLLVDHYGLPGAYGILCNVLNLIKLQVFENSAEYNAVRAVGLNTLMQEYFDSCNFGVSGLCCLVCLLTLIP